MVVASFVVLCLGWLALPVIWFAFFRGKDDDRSAPEDRDSEVAG
jgi:hypothetical protein